MGVEITGKTLGLIGCGNIGSIVADRARGLKMKVIAYDPFLTPERAVDLGVEKVELEDLFARADFITLHTPMTEKTRNIIEPKTHRQDQEGRAHHQLRPRRAGRRGGARRRGWKAAMSRARRWTSSWWSRPRKISCSARRTSWRTPHLGASTVEAQENVALQVAEQMSDYLLQGALFSAGSRTEISREMIPMTTSNSTKVNALRAGFVT